MKRLIIIFFVLLAAVWLGVKIHLDAGYVFIAYNHWSFTTTLWFALFALLVLLFLFYLIIRLSGSFGVLSCRIKAWFSGYRDRKAREQTIAGLGELIKGYWGVAEKKLIKAAQNSDMALINYVAAAHAAQNQGAYDRRNNYLRLAQNISSHNVFAVGLVQARLQFISNQLEGAVATLHHLKEISPKHQLVLQLLYKVYLQLNDWENLRDLLPLLRRRRVLNMNELATLEQQVYVILLNANIIKDLEGLHKAWRDVPRYLRHNAVILVAYSERLIAYGADEEAESLLRKALAELWDEKLVECYSKVKGKNPVKQLAVAESWLQGHESPLLFLCLGRLCKRQSLWGKARYYLEKSLKLLPTRAAYYELGTIMEMENDQHNALLCYRKSCEVE